MFLDLTVDGEPKGRLVIQLSSDAPTGTRRFAQLSEGLNGVGYRLSKFDGIAQVSTQLQQVQMQTRQDCCIEHASMFWQTVMSGSQ